MNKVPASSVLTRTTPYPWKNMPLLFDMSFITFKEQNVILILTAYNN